MYISAKVQITLGKEEKRTMYCTQRSRYACEIREVMRQKKYENNGKLIRTLTGENHITLRIQIVKEKFTTRMISRSRTNR